MVFVVDVNLDFTVISIFIMDIREKHFRASPTGNDVETHVAGVFPDTGPGPNGANGAVASVEWSHKGGGFGNTPAVLPSEFIGSVNRNVKVRSFHIHDNEGVFIKVNPAVECSLRNAVAFLQHNPPAEQLSKPLRFVLSGHRVSSDFGVGDRIKSNAILFESLLFGGVMRTGLDVAQLITTCAVNDVGLHW